MAQFERTSIVHHSGRVPVAANSQPVPYGRTDKIRFVARESQVMAGLMRAAPIAAALWLGLAGVVSLIF